MGILKNVPVDIPNKSSHNLSHSNTLTTKVGTITPILVDTLIPNDTIDIDISGEIQLPPMATDFYGVVKGKIEAFFVPFRLLWGGWEDYITSLETNPYGSEVILDDGTDSGYIIPKNPTFSTLPSLNLYTLQDSSVEDAAKYPSNKLGHDEYGPGTLADYLGFKFVSDSTLAKSKSYTVPNCLPFIAYHFIWDSWYRNTFIQKPCFSRSSPNSPSYYYPDIGPDSTIPIASLNLPYTSGTAGHFDTANNHDFTQIDSYFASLVNGQLADNVFVSELRQRNWELDYFTNAKPEPQAGDPVSIKIASDDTFTIASLRAANSVQQYRERNNLLGFRYADQIRGKFGINPSDAVMQRPVYLGQVTLDVYTRGIYQQTPAGGSSGSPSASTSANPFNSVAAKYGSPIGVVTGQNIVRNFTATEHGFIFINFTLCPQAQYSSGIRRYLYYSDPTDFADPLLQGVGNQAIYKQELIADENMLGTIPHYPSLKPNVDQSDFYFGYTDRYAEYKDYLDEVHGLLVDGQSLDAFALQRSFAGQNNRPELSSDFITIPTDYLDQVAAVQGDVSKYGCWCNFYFDYKKNSVLQPYSIPTLGRPANTHVETVPIGGRMIA